MEISLESIAVALADEGVPLRAIARVTRIPLADLRERLRDAKDSAISNCMTDLAPFEEPQADEDDGYNMASLKPSQTGVDNTIFVSVKGRARHAARIKIAIDPPDCFDITCRSVSVAVHDYREIGTGLTPYLREQVRRFVDRNRAVLLAYWDGKLATEDFMAALKR
jgi:hypothetical protein